MTKHRSRDGLTLIEVLFMVVIVVILAAIFLRPAGRPPRASRIKCVNNLKNIGLAFRIFGTDHNDRLPTELLLTNGVALSSIDPLRVFLALTNELSTPKILYCPSDTKRHPVDSVTNLTLNNISYFVSLTARETETQSFLAGDRNLQTNGIPIGSGLFPITSKTPLTWSREIHNELGNILTSDGSVQQFSSARLPVGIKDQALGGKTNWLAIP